MMMMMSTLHPATELLPSFSSPTISSVSSSDLDTASTGSFFPDRSTSLGALMGVFPAVTCRSPAPRCPDGMSTGSTLNKRIFVGRRRRKTDTTTERRRKRVRRRKYWWWLCSGEASKPSSLGEFLEIERRFGVEAIFSDALMDVNNFSTDNHRNNGRVLFADGRVLPPQHISDVNEGTPFICSLCRFPVLLAAICCGRRRGGCKIVD